MTPRAVLFDLDDTLAETMQAPDEAMVARLQMLIARVPVAIVTGRDFARVQTTFLSQMVTPSNAQNFYVLANGASQGYRFKDGQWEEVYSFELSPEEKARIRAAIDAATKATGVLEGLPQYGERVVDKRTMISFAMLGVPLPPTVTRDWDPDNKLRKALWSDLAPRLPAFDVSMGGMTAIDIARKGINKAYGVRWLSEKLGIPASEMVFVGDALFDGGNDSIVKTTGIQTHAVNDPSDTAAFIDALLKAAAN